MCERALATPWGTTERSAYTKALAEANGCHPPPTSAEAGVRTFSPDHPGGAHHRDRSPPVRGHRTRLGRARLRLGRARSGSPSTTKLNVSRSVNFPITLIKRCHQVDTTGRHLLLTPQRSVRHLSVHLLYRRPNFR